MNNNIFLSFFLISLYLLPGKGAGMTNENNKVPLELIIEEKKS